MAAPRELILERREGVDAPEFWDDPEFAGELLSLDDALAEIDQHEQVGGLSPKIADELRELARQQDGLSLGQLGIGMGRTHLPMLAELADRLPAEMAGTLPPDGRRLQRRLREGFRPSIHGGLAPRIASPMGLPLLNSPRVAARPRERRAFHRSRARSPCRDEPDLDPPPLRRRLLTLLWELFR